MRGCAPARAKATAFGAWGLVCPLFLRVEKSGLEGRAPESPHDRHRLRAFGPDRRVPFRWGFYRAGSVPSRVSSSTIEDKISQCAAPSAINAFTCAFDGHPLYVLNIPGVGSWAYDASRIGTVDGAYGDSASRGQWGQWTSFGQATFRGVGSAFAGGRWFVGDDASGTVWALTKGVYADGADPLTRGASAFIKIEEGSPRCNALVLHCVQGVGLASGPGSAPIVEMRWSDDLGRTFGAWRPATLGAEGDYRARAYWQRLGQMRAPGRLVQVRCSDPVNVALSHLELNPARPAQ